uniref:uncharacterized protein LOC122580743 n=1 Tax=Erigeron canadensis TaxID=72917 RepID=UPI001CB98423|nr:uncharacterized protein LOC122580743 [Erigeron canadensis]
MDTSWISLPRSTIEYKRRLDEFLDYIFYIEGKNGQISCPCIDCGNQIWVDREEARTHLLCEGFIKGYTIFPLNSKPCDTPMLDAEDDMQGLVHDAFHGFGENRLESKIETQNEGRIMPNTTTKKFYEVLEDAKKELYPGCKKFSVLSFIIRLYHGKCVGKCSDKGFSLMLDTVREAFPDASIPKSLYEVRKIIRELGLSYDKIDACPNDCMLYWKENINKTKCDTCHTSRYKTSEDSKDESTTPSSEKKIAAKILRYFPLIPRLQRLFMSSKTAAYMRWHEESRTKDGYLRYPADTPAWKTFDFKYPDFACESRNVRLGLATDGFNPYRTMSVSHSTWHVVLMPYNLPPWMCMQQPYFFLSLLIPGPSAPGNNIDVYMEPLVAELKELWDINGVETYDASKNSNFQMRASLLWTISDFPAYANLSGWSTKGELSCPSCHRHTKAQRLTHSKKYCFMGHRRYLSCDHYFRKDKKSFDGTEEQERQPRGLTGSEVLDELHGFEIKFGKLVKSNPNLPFNWKKRSIFFELPYWKDNLLRHNLDVMHIEKNVCDNII